MELPVYCHSCWHLKEQLRKGLCQQVLANVFKMDLKDYKEIFTKVDEYALKHYTAVCR
jgi:type I restriction enzyme R subunit